MIFYGVPPQTPAGECGQSIFPSGRRLRRRLILAVLIPLHPHLQNHEYGSAVSGRGGDPLVGFGAKPQKKKVLERR